MFGYLHPHRDWISDHTCTHVHIKWLWNYKLQIRAFVVVQQQMLPHLLAWIRTTRETPKGIIPSWSFLQGSTKDVILILIAPPTCLTKESSNVNKLIGNGYLHIWWYHGPFHKAFCWMLNWVTPSGNSGDDTIGTSNKPQSVQHLP